jgi:putative membrane protein
MMTMHGQGWDHMGSWGWFGMLMMLLFWFGFVALIVWAIAGPRAWRQQAPSSGQAGDPAMTILRERFARGEITAEEFERASRTLNESRQ